MKLEDCYDVLGVSVWESEASVRAAYRDLVAVWHPDRFQGNPKLAAKAGAKLKDINAAFAQIKDAGFPESDNGSRAEDSSGTAGQASSPGQSTPTGPPSSFALLGQRLATRIGVLLLVVVFIKGCSTLREKPTLVSDPPASSTVPVSKDMQTSIAPQAKAPPTVKLMVPSKAYMPFGNGPKRRIIKGVRVTIDDKEIAFMELDPFVNWLNKRRNEELGDAEVDEVAKFYASIVSKVNTRKSRFLSEEERKTIIGVAGLLENFDASCFELSIMAAGGGTLYSHRSERSCAEAADMWGRCFREWNDSDNGDSASIFADSIGFEESQLLTDEVRQGISSYYGTEAEFGRIRLRMRKRITEIDTASRSLPGPARLVIGKYLYKRVLAAWGNE